MATRRTFKSSKIRKENEAFSPLKAIVETAFYGNNVTAVKTLADAYQLAHDAPLQLF